MLFSILVYFFSVYASVQTFSINLPSSSLIISPAKFNMLLNTSIEFCQKNLFWFYNASHTHTHTHTYTLIPIFQNNSILLTSFVSFFSVFLNIIIITSSSANSNIWITCVSAFYCFIFLLVFAQLVLSLHILCTIFFFIEC